MTKIKKIFLILIIAFLPIMAWAAKRTFDVNDKVKVYWRNKWEPCTVLKVKPGKYFVHFEADERIFDKWVKEEIVEDFNFAIGDLLLVEKDGKWVVGKVLAAGTTQYKIHFLDYDSTHDDWLGPNRIKAIDFSIGDKIMVMWQGDWFEAEIINESGGKYLVHFIGFPSSEDKWVTMDEMKKN
ncbi:MAG: Tudor-knot domain-containing protein [Vulcanimicrobiota bacterium]